MKFGIIGCGYVGLTTAVAISKTSKVFIWDIDNIKLKNLTLKKLPFKDIDLEKDFKKYNSNLFYCKELLELIEKVNIFILALPTDYNQEQNTLDTSELENLINFIFLNKDKELFKIIIKSTVPINFTQIMRNKFQSENIFFIPEFLREGKAYYDTINPSRIVVGGEKDKLLDVITFMYSNSNNIQYVSTTEAESIKLFSNTYLAMRIAFFNELDQFAEEKNLNSYNIIKGVCSDGRIGDYYNNPSFGYGGYCLPKDSKELANLLKKNSLIPAIVESNEKRKKYIINKFIKNKKRIGIYRMQMKKNSDNMRGSVLLEIVNTLISHGIQIAVYEPLLKNINFLDKKIKICKSIDELNNFSEIIIANRIDKEITPYKDKVYTRDIFFRD